MSEIGLTDVIKPADAPARTSQTRGGVSLAGPFPLGEVWCSGRAHWPGHGHSEWSAQGRAGLVHVLRGAGAVWSVVQSGHPGDRQSGVASEGWTIPDGNAWNTQEQRRDNLLL